MYGETCRYQHNNVVCVENNCNVFQCDKRHPRTCNFWKEFGQCKFTIYCKYKHEEQKYNFENCEKIKVIEKKLEEIEKTSRRRETSTAEKAMLKKLEAFEEDNGKKMETFEIKIKQFHTVIEEKEIQIASLVKKLKEVENKFTELINKVDVQGKNKKKKSHQVSNL